ncbi:MAG: hypothetical protein IJ480_01085 [Clostridia bacterium]|nr:hypothetical protein [Clostridia bacterium]
MRKLLILAAALILFLTACGKEETEPVRQLFFPEYTVLQKNVTVPAWFYPETGKVEFLCPDCVHQCVKGEYACREAVHGHECPFYEISERYSLVDGVLYYFAGDDDNVALYSYDTEDHTREVLMETDNPLWRSSYIFKKEYLYSYDRDSEMEGWQSYGNMNRIHLPSMRVTDISGQQIPWKIVDGIGYYNIADSSPYIVSGLYSQPLYARNELPPAKELLLHEVDLGVSLYMDENAVYWSGTNYLPDEMEETESNLYRYDRHTKETTLLIRDYRFGVETGYGEYLYDIRHDETGSVLVRVHGTLGDQKVLYTPEEGWSLTGGARAAGQYIIADMKSDTAYGKLVYDTAAETCQTYVLQETDAS